ncbi:MAG: hypothetical protein ACR2ML_03975 [Solirubrobacteraceae bacterium]
MSRATRRAVEPVALCALLALAYLVLAPASADLAAQEYRVGLFGDEGFVLWDGGWYGGHHTLGYSVLFPALGALLGAREAGALAAVAAAGLFAALVHGRWGDRARLGASWLGLGAGAWLFTGRLTFLLGVAVGLGSLLAAQRGRTVPALALAALCGLASPVAALFLSICGVGWAVVDRARGLSLAAAALAPVLLLTLAFPEGGSHPFQLRYLLPILAIAAAGVALLPREEDAVRAGAVLYALTAVALFLVETPVGGNVTRLGALFAGPVLACALIGRRPVALALAALPLAWWQLYPPIRDVAKASGDPSTRAAFHRPLVEEIRRRGGPAGRVEVPPLRNHAEARFVAPELPLARGWERQLDRLYGRLFYDDPLTPANYRVWLDENAVRWVAVADAPLDAAAEDEARLIAGGPDYLRPVWRDADWQLYEVRTAVPLVQGSARLRALHSDAVSLDAIRPGATTVRVRFSPYWAVVEGAGCVARASGGWTRVEVRRPGRLRLAMRFAPARVAGRGSRCAGR